jgi:putative molybdopterin biosynthesis protein
MSIQKTDHQQSPPEINNRLREWRQSLELSQKQLALMAGITRQAICAIEASQYSPSTAVALKLAEVLRCRVEDLFSLRASGEIVQGELVGPLPRDPLGVRVKVVRIGQRNLVVPIGSLGALFNFIVPADGITVGDRMPGNRAGVRLLRHRRSIDDQILVAGCNPAILLAAEYVRRGSDQGRVLTCAMSSEAAVSALRDGKVHVAGMHLVDERSGESNLPFLRRHLKGLDCLVVTFASWEEGLIVAQGNPKNIREVADLFRRGIRFINREKGSGARRLIDCRLRALGLEFGRIKDYQRTVGSHLDVAWMISHGLADVGVGAKVAAAAYGLDFISLQQERYDLVIPQTYLSEAPTLQIFLDILTSAAFRSEVEALGGYDTRDTGKIAASLN